MVKERDLFKEMLMVWKPERVKWLKEIKPTISKNDFSRLLREAWTDVECPSMAGVRTPTLIKWFKEADKRSLMTEEEYEVYSNLPEIVTAYRGSTFLRLESGISWTLSRKVGEFFYSRVKISQEGISQGYKPPYALFKAAIPREYVLAYFNNRKEEELIVDARKVWSSHEKAISGGDGREVLFLEKMR